MADTLALTGRLTARTMVKQLSLESELNTGLDIGPGTVSACLLQISDQTCLVVATDPMVERGAVGLAEVRQCISALSIARQRTLPVVWLLDTSGIRVTEGIDAIAALRQLIRVVAGLRSDGTKMLAVSLGSTFGGMSVIAALCERCIVHEQTLIAVSGPRLIEVADPAMAFRARDNSQVQSLIGGSARARLSTRIVNIPSGEKAICLQIDAWLHEPAVTQSWSELAACEDVLAARLSARLADGARIEGAIFDTDDDDQWNRSGEDCLQLIVRNKSGATAADCLRLAQALRIAATTLSPHSIAIHVDTPGHSSAPLDEELHLGQFLAHLALTVSQTVRTGIRVDLVVAGDGGGAILGAIGGPATTVTMTADSRLHVLPPASLAALNGRFEIAPFTLAESITAGAVDTQYLQSEHHHAGK